jgi:hypothetical protein
MTESDGSARYEYSGSFVVEKELLAIYLPRAVVDGATSLVIDGYAPGLAVEAVAGTQLNVPRHMEPRAAIEWCIAQGQPWVRCEVPGFDSEVAVRSDRIVGIVGPRW